MHQVDVEKCWGFNDDEQPPYPTIEIMLSSAVRKATIRPKVDTGFNGYLAVDAETVNRLRLTPAGIVLVKTATKHSEVPVYAVNLSQPDLAIACKTLALGTERSLVGRKLLQNRTWLLDCEKGRFCAIAQTGGGPSGAEPLSQR